MCAVLIRAIFRHFIKQETATEKQKLRKIVNSVWLLV